MEEIKNTISDAQKAAQKKYDQKTKTVSIKYTPADMEDYERLKKYIDKTGKSINGFIKELVNDFFESGQNQKPVEDKMITPLQKKRRKQEEYYPYCNVSSDGIQFFYDKFGENIADNILDEFECIVKSGIEEVLESKGDGLDEWAVDIQERIDDGEYQGKSTEEIRKELINELCDIL